MSIEQQKCTLNRPEVIHFRIPLHDEPGIELIPCTHKCCDSEEELQIRMEKSGRTHSENISTTGETIPLKKGDVLVFSGQMIHRGLYGKNRLTLDVFFCEGVPELLKFVKARCLPNQEILSILQNATAFRNTIKVNMES